MSSLTDRRRAGVLLHPTCLPGAGYCGDFGSEARRFIDLIADAGMQIWQVLPLGPTHPDGCPYQSSSVHAGNPDLIDLQWLVDQGLLSGEQALAGQRSPRAKREALTAASRRFFQQVETAAESPMVDRYRQFLQEADFWLEDYVRFQAFRDAERRRPWSSWPSELRHCESQACDRRADELADVISALRFRQFVFNCQWHELRHYANERGILLFGDMPIYVDLESADVWAHQDLFDLDEEGQPITVTGVPPDYFSEEGQLWGNPQYHWDRMKADSFAWWLQRFDSAARQFDIVRIDHFRALEAYWEIPAGATSAKDGRWVPAPGRELLRLVRQAYPDLRLVAENLGTISPEVEALRAEFDLPGMLILQFAFDGNPENPYLSHRHSQGDIVYTGTHDNNTTLGWFNSLDEGTRGRVYQYFNNPAEAMPTMLIAQAMASPATTAIVPWQDFLGLDGAHRMNTPGTTEGNWQWRFGWDQVPDSLASQIHDMLSFYDRLPPGPRSSDPVSLAKSA
jgi:4-alpha-glucanotransferase